MTRTELLKGLREAGVKVKRGLTVDELQDAYDNRPVVEPSLLDDPIIGETPLSEEKKEDSTVKDETDDSFTELLGKIEAADIPVEKEAVEKPLVEKTKRRRKKGESSAESFRVEGYVLLLVTDTIFPFSFAFLNNLLDKKVKVNASDLQLTEKDFNKIEPLADQAADFMAVNLNPIAGFFLIASFMYANNLLALRMQLTNTKL